MSEATIAAISTGLSVGGISIIRLSGEDAVHIADSVFRAASGKKLSESKSFTAHFGHIHDGDEVVDEVICLVMLAPKTYTREDVVEIDCHGGIAVTRRVLDLVIKNGAVPAEPGEFTKRAFLNGRIDLSRAEAVADLISSESCLAMKNSVSQLRGVVQKRISNMRSSMLDTMAYIEASLDDPEHYSLDDYYLVLRPIVDKLSSEISKLIVSSENGRLIKEGINTCILGKPNAGKSSLLNLILGEERAIVTDIAGTTRDTLNETCVIDGILLNIIDTAGIRNTLDPVESIGVERARKCALDADLILFVVDSSSHIDDNDRDILCSVGDTKCIVLINKSDLPCVLTKEETDLFADYPQISISAVTGYGLEELEKMISSMFFSKQLDFNNEVYITGARQKNLLVEAGKSIDRVASGMDEQMPEDLLIIDLMDCYEKLGLITGESVNDDLVNNVFSKFCMGK